MKCPRGAALLAGITAALTLAACGVPTSGVIQAGAPASGLAPPERAPASVDVNLFFLHDGSPAPYPRQLRDPGIGALISLLFDGPTASESATATTELPRPTDPPHVQVDGEGTVVIQLTGVEEPFSRPAMRQLECTVAVKFPADPAGGAAPAATATATPHRAAHTGIRVIGDGWTRTQSDGSCPTRF